ncbi:hypothetical protein Hypma_000374 [Hypsizygus marmoreus]|uniref:Uncharacterized protein n=1 Tax=Hypsizygus marmoreus TaxID=39966 RepID=A0A369J951_HYPMA|nr:hypothetical protein Hypma_000374 [Hypsizygus marmoreus]
MMVPFDIAYGLLVFGIPGPPFKQYVMRRMREQQGLAQRLLNHHGERAHLNGHPAGLELADEGYEGWKADASTLRLLLGVSQSICITRELIARASSLLNRRLSSGKPATSSCG